MGGNGECWPGRIDYPRLSDMVNSHRCLIDLVRRRQQVTVWEILSACRNHLPSIRFPYFNDMIIRVLPENGYQSLGRNIMGMTPYHIRCRKYSVCSFPPIKNSWALCESRRKSENDRCKNPVTFVRKGLPTGPIKDRKFLCRRMTPSRFRFNALAIASVSE